MRRQKTYEIIEIQFPDMTDEQPEPLVDFLGELLARERIKELESESGAVCKFSSGEGDRS